MQPNQRPGATRRLRSRNASLAGAILVALAAQLVAAPVVAAQTPQAITFSLPASGFVGSTVDLVASADSGLTVLYAMPTPDVCTIDGASLTLVAPGTCTVTASQPGDETYDPAADVDASVIVEAAPPPDPVAQVITFALPASGFVASTVVLDGFADSGLPVSYATSTPDICSIDGTTLALNAAGTCTVTASQAGDDGHTPAPDVTASVIVTVAPPDPEAQTIAFSLPASGFVGSTIRLAGVAGSGLAIAYASVTPTKCTVAGTTLALDSQGTCTVRATQPGDSVFLAAPPVEASMSVEAVPQGVDLGKYAVNGTVRAVVADATTGRTYLGGDFSEVGLRTGPVAVVDPPDVGDGHLQAASPEILGTVNQVFADDRAGDPGFFVVGELIAVNGQPVPQTPVVRMHLDAGGTRWVIDPTWSASTVADGCSSFGRARSWIATSEYLIAGAYVGAWNRTGLTIINRGTGICTNSLPSVTTPLPALASCEALDYCYATADQLAWDAASNRLVVGYMTIVGPTSIDSKMEESLASYDLNPGGAGRLWVTALQSEAPPEAHDWRANVTGLSAGHQKVLVRGWFPLDSGHDTDSGLLSIDAGSGAIAQRWSGAGEQSLADGSILDPGTVSPCLAGLRTSGLLFDLDGAPAEWHADLERSMLCRYDTTGETVVASQVGDFTIANDGFEPMPTVQYTAPDGSAYLVGPHMAVDLDAGIRADWHPDPGTPLSARPTSIAHTADGFVLAGDFTFVRGHRSPGVVALTTSLSPDPAFTSPLGTAWPPDVRALALDQGWLLVGGNIQMPATPDAEADNRSILALDPTSGRLIDWGPPAARPGTVYTIAVNPADGRFWIGGTSAPQGNHPGTPLLHFTSPTEGATPLAVPSLTCLDAGGPYTMQPTCGAVSYNGTEVRVLAYEPGGGLYLAGAFGAVDDQVRRGLARLDAGGQLDSWSADLLGVVPMAAGSYLWQLEPHSLAVLHGQLIVGGIFCSLHPSPGGGGAGSCISPLLVFSTETGTLLRPTDAAVSPWFQVFGWWSAGYSILASDTGVVVAMGDVGVMVLDPVTLDFDAPASAPLLSSNWWAHDFRNGVFALAAPATPPAALVAGRSRVAIAAQIPSTRIVMAGSISRWGFHVAGNMISANVQATPVAPVLPRVTAPVASLRTAATLSGSSAPVHLTWSGSDVGGPGIDHYILRRSTNGAAWTLVASPIGRTVDLFVATSGTVRFQVSAVDTNGNPGAWATGPTLTPRLIQQSSTAVHYGRGWTTTTSSVFAGGSARYAKTAGSTASYAFTGRSIALVSTTALSRGKVKVYVNGVYLATVDLRSSSTRYRALVWQRTWTTSATRTIKLVVVGTAGRPRVDLDAFVTLK